MRAVLEIARFAVGEIEPRLVHECGRVDRRILADKLTMREALQFGVDARQQSILRGAVAGAHAFQEIGNRIQFQDRPPYRPRWSHLCADVTLPLRDSAPNCALQKDVGTAQCRGVSPIRFRSQT